VLFGVSQSVVEGLVEGVGGVVARRLVLMLCDVFASAYRELYSLVESFDEDLSRGLWMLMSIIGRLSFAVCI
jgi:hypothetical protein